MKTISRISDVCGWLAGWMFFAIGLMITYEVVVRYVFTSPTIWAEEMAQFFQIWATYLAAAYVLKHRDLIVIDFVLNRLGVVGRRMADTLSLLFIAGFSLVAVYYGVLIAAESIAMGRATSTMLAVPKWMTESAVPIGFGLLALQCLVELVALYRGAESERGDPSQ